MEIENHKEEVPFSHYQQLFAAADPEEIRRRLPNVPFENGVFTLKLLGIHYAISYPAGEVTPQPALPVCTFLLRYLLESKETAWGGTYRTFREMPWGEMYIKPYTGRVLTRAAFTFGTRVDDFRSASEAMGAVKLTHGDAGYDFALIGNYHMQLLVWEGDDEFPPNAQVLYSDNFSEGFAAEDRVVAGDILITAVKAAMIKGK